MCVCVCIYVVKGNEKNRSFFFSKNMKSREERHKLFFKYVKCCVVVSVVRVVVGVLW